MTIEVLPLGTRCQLACRYCYQDPIRDAGNQVSADYDMHAMKRALEKENYQFTLFGGEPLLMPLEDLEELWRWGQERFGANNVQTSGALVTDAHLELFRKYDVAVGLSLDGPGALNDVRWAGSVARTRAATQHAEGVLYRLLEVGHPVGLITTLHRGNASAQYLPELLDWFRELDRRGLRNTNLHLLEVESEDVRDKWALSEDELVTALLACVDLHSELERLVMQPITDMVELLLGDDRSVSCTWNACDAGTTRAVQGIDGRGEKVNCSRTNKAGVDLPKADRELMVRPLALYHVPQEHGGCAGCRFWYACKGHCPGEAEQGDWRRKTEHCGTLKRVFGELERRLAALGFRPLSRDPVRLERVEQRLLEAYAAGRNLSIRDADNGGLSAAPRGHGDAPHGDHDDTKRPVVNHGDHTDAG